MAIYNFQLGGFSRLFIILSIASDYFINCSFYDMTYASKVNIYTVLLN